MGLSRWRRILPLTGNTKRWAVWGGVCWVYTVVQHPLFSQLNCDHFLHFLKAIAEVVLEGFEVLEILVVSDWLDLHYRSSFPPSYIHACSVFACLSWHSGVSLHCWRGWATNFWELPLGLSIPKETGGSKSMNFKTFPRFLDVLWRASMRKYVWLHCF